MIELTLIVYHNTKAFYELPTNFPRKNLPAGRLYKKVLCGPQLLEFISSN